MDIVLVAVLILFLVALIVGRVRQSSAPSQVRARTASPPLKQTPIPVAESPRGGAAPANNDANPFRAVSIKAGSGACTAVTALAGERFLIGQVPHLPLAECGSKSCTCKYVHHDDRRLPDDDRRAPAALTTDLYESTGNQDRRARKRGRRVTD